MTKSIINVGHVWPFFRSMSTRWYPIYQRGNPQLRVFLPNFWMKLVKLDKISTPSNKVRSLERIDTGNLEKVSLLLQLMPRPRGHYPQWSCHVISCHFCERHIRRGGGGRWGDNPKHYSRLEKRRYIILYGQHTPMYCIKKLLAHHCGKMPPWPGLQLIQVPIYRGNRLSIISIGEISHDYLFCRGVYNCSKTIFFPPPFHERYIFSPCRDILHK
jgi:hypothetical protein